MGYLLSDYSISYFPDNGTGYHPLYQDTTNSIVYELLGVKPKEMIGRSSITGFTEVYSICGALIKVNNRYTPMVISTSPSGCRVRKKTDEERANCGSFEEINYDPDNFEGDDENYDYSLRYDDFIAPLVAYCQNLKKKNKDLEKKYNELTSTVNEILKKLN